MAVGASIIPLTLGLDAMRQLLFPSGAALGPFGSRWRSALAVLCVLFLAAARWLLGYMERIAVREGRLLESRR